MNVYVTFDAVTHGLRRGKLMYETVSKPLGAYIAIGSRDPEFIPDRYWYVNHKSAVKSCERQRRAKVEQLQKQIERIERMEFK